MTNMATDFDQITVRIQRSIESFSPPAEHVGFGIELGREWFVDQLNDLKASIVHPFFAEMRDDFGDGLVVLPVIVVADDSAGTVIAFDPKADEFVLANREVDPVATRSADLVSCGVRGDVVDCFLSR